MAAACEVCGKKRVVGHLVSHSHHKTKRSFRPNLKSVKAIDRKSTRRMTVCTRCIRSGWVKKAV